MSWHLEGPIVRHLRAAALEQVLDAGEHGYTRGPGEALELAVGIAVWRALDEEQRFTSWVPSVDVQYIAFEVGDVLLTVRPDSLAQPDSVRLA